MSIIRKTISFTQKHDEWMKARVASGQFATDSEYIRDLVRRDQAEYENAQVIKAAILEGMESGVSERNVIDILKSVERRLDSNGKLPT